MNEFIKIIIGDNTWIQFFGFLWFFIIGYIIYGLLEISGRDVKSPHTPQKWSWSFWFNDNIKRYMSTILCTYIMFRFYIEFSGHAFSNFEALMMGLLGDGLSATLKKRIKILSSDRGFLMKAYNEKNPV